MKEMKTFLSENQTLRLDWMTPIWFHSVPSVVHDAISDMDPSRASELVFGGAFSWGHIRTKVFIAKNEDDLIKQAKEWHKKETNAN